jgi:hypothetical protein
MPITRPRPRTRERKPSPRSPLRRRATKTKQPKASKAALSRACRGVDLACATDKVRCGCSGGEWGRDGPNSDAECHGGNPALLPRPHVSPGDVAVAGKKLGLTPGMTFAQFLARRRELSPRVLLPPPPRPRTRLTTYTPLRGGPRRIRKRSELF